jgi:peptidyl-prolyl cis-trans isomerase C
MKNLILALIFALTLTLTSAPPWCHGQQAVDDTGEALATVGDRKITRSMLDHIIQTIPEENRVPFLTPDGRKKILEEVISFTLFAQAAKNAGLDKEPAIRTRLDYAQTEYLAREFFRRKVEEADPITEEELREYFQKNKREFQPPEQIKARHVLVPTEAEANKAMEKLKNGAEFSKVAEEMSIDPAAKRGGVLERQDGSEWLPRGTFENSFEHVLFNIPTGEYGGPIKTQFGWHVLYVRDKRVPPPPTFVRVRRLIRNRLLEQRNNELRKELTEQLKKDIPVEIK